MNLLGRALLGDTPCFGEIVRDRFHVTSGLPSTDMIARADRSRWTTSRSPCGSTACDSSTSWGLRRAGHAPRPGAVPDVAPEATNDRRATAPRSRCPPADRPAPTESELAVVVGRPLRKALPTEARDAIFGWTVFIHFTAPEYGVTSSGRWRSRSTASPRGGRDPPRPDRPRVLKGSRSRGSSTARRSSPATRVLRLHAERDDQPRQPPHQPVSG